ncbi:MAG: hypothetical protein PWQ20_556 [Thermotogaceae bacterium]|jgi:predicted transcriptional regulator YheO|nr:hypothetical protein [Thermotogaceae bacterium]MDN5337486.1 hypothetical protein [Thermotogaceae bacterium]
MRKKIHPLLKSFSFVVKGLAEMLGPDYEIVLHDVSTPEKSIIAIENGHITGREVGGPLTDLGLYILSSKKFKNTNYLANYMTEVNGKKLRSTTIFIRNEKKEIVGLLCINYDMTKAEILKSMVDHLVSLSKIDIPPSQETESFPKKIDDLLAEELKNARKILGKPLQLATKEERLKIVNILHNNGFFMLKGSVEVLANEMRISKFTVYSYLREIKK